MKQLHNPLQRQCNEGYQFFGVLHIGAILTKDGPKVIEFNARLVILKLKYY